MYVCSVCVCMYVWMYVCNVRSYNVLFECIYVCMYVMYVCMYGNVM